MSHQRMDRLVPPEGVPLFFGIAGVGVRTAAQITDLLITGGAAAAIFVLLMMLNALSPTSMVAIAAMLFFLIRIPYYAASELAWNGQTIGKRLMKIKVVSVDGRALTTQALIVRNLMKEAEVFLPATLVLMLGDAGAFLSLIYLGWIMGVLLVPLSNRRRQRLGDIIAGTFVIHLPTPILLKDLALEDETTTASSHDFQFLPHHLEHYGAFELQALEGFLRESDRQKGPEADRQFQTTLAAIVEQIRLKIDYADAVPEADQLTFLNAFYKAQRSYLERRQLFGDKRVDKHHASKQNTEEHRSE